MKNDLNMGTHVGTSSILLILMVLSLISFSTLSIANANADYRLTTNLANRTTLYYSVSHSANGWVAAMDTDNPSASFKSFTLTDNQTLEVAIEPDSETDPAKNILVTRWQVVTDDDIEYDTTLPVFK